MGRRRSKQGLASRVSHFHHGLFSFLLCCLCVNLLLSVANVYLHTYIYIYISSCSLLFYFSVFWANNYFFFSLYAYIYAYIHIYFHVLIKKFSSACMHTYIYACMHAYIYYLYIYTDISYIYICVCLTYEYTFACMHIYACIYLLHVCKIYMHAYNKSELSRCLMHIYIYISMCS